MTGFPLVPLFIGPVELLLVGAVILVLIFGSRAGDVAKEAGSAVGKVRTTRRTAEKEIEDVRTDIEEGVEPVKEEVQAVEEEIETVEKEVKDAEKDIQENFDPARDPTGDTKTSSGTEPSDRN